MKTKLYSLFMLLAFAQSPAFSQVTVISEDFDSYTAGELLAANSDLWITWSGVDAEDAPVSNALAFSGANSIYVEGQFGPVDLVLPFPEAYTSGIYELRFVMNVVTGKGGYFNIQASNIPAVAWQMEMYFDDNGNGNLVAGGVTTPFTFEHSKWLNLRLYVDLNEDKAEMYLNESLLYSWVWSLGIFGTGDVKAIGGIDFYAYALNSALCGYYVDDIVLTEIESGTCQPNTPQSLATVGVGATQAKLIWTQGIGATHYIIKTSTPNGGNVYFSNKTEIVLNDLQPGTLHKWKVASLCGNPVEGQSDWSYSSLFSTNPLKEGAEAIGPVIEVYPNPASDQFTVAVALPDQQQLYLEMMDVTGRKVYVSDKGLVNGTVTYQVELDHLPAGSYFLNVFTEDNRTVRKINVVR